MIDLGLEHPTNKVINAHDSQSEDLKIHRSQTDHHQISSKSIFVERQKRKQPLPLFILNLIAIMLLSFFNFVIFVSQDMIVVASFIGSVLLLSIVISATNSCVLTVTVKDMCALYFLLDSICVALCTCIIGMVILVSPPPYVSATFGTLNLAFFFFAGDQRVIIANVKYQRWETILLKLSITE